MGIVILCIAIGAVLYFNYQEKKEAEAKKRNSSNDTRQTQAGS